MEQALKTTDLLLQGGGFGMIAVDLGDVPPQFARRIPLTSWFRFRRAVENTPSVLLVVEQEPYAKTCASLVLRMEPTARNSRRSAQSDPRPTHAEILHGLSIEAEVVHARVPKKPAQSAAVFEAATPWAG